MAFQFFDIITYSVCESDVMDVCICSVNISLQWYITLKVTLNEHTGSASGISMNDHCG